MGGSGGSTGHTVTGTGSVRQVSRDAVGEDLLVHLADRGARAVVVAAGDQTGQTERNGLRAGVDGIRQGIQVRKHVVAIGADELRLGDILCIGRGTQHRLGLVFLEVVEEDVAGVDGVIGVVPDAAVLLLGIQHLHLIGVLHRGRVGDVHDIVAAAVEHHIGETGHEGRVGTLESGVATEQRGLDVVGIRIDQALRHRKRLVPVDEVLGASARGDHKHQYCKEFEYMLHNNYFCLVV